jgi:hypothetical protein
MLTFFSREEEVTQLLVFRSDSIFYFLFSIF